MSSFDQREKAEEGKFANREEAHFKARAKRDKLVGLWAAEKLGLNGAEAEAYATSIIAADLEEHGDGDVIRKLKADFAAKDVVVSDHQINRTLDEMMAEANKQMKA